MTGPRTSPDSMTNPDSMPDSSPRSTKLHAAGPGPEPERELAWLRQQRALAQQRIDSLKSQLSSLEKRYEADTRKLRKAVTQRKRAQKEAQSTRDSLSFQLGHLLLQGFKSVSGVFGIPAALLALRKQAKQRERVRAAKLGQGATTGATIPSRPERELPAPPPAQFPLYQPSLEPRPKALTIASILDTFSHRCFEYEANLLPLSPQNWRQEVEQAKPSLLLVESAWEGNDGQWRRMLTKYAEQPTNPLRELLNWCGRHGIPRVFWNKEDPSNFDSFKHVVSDFDHVFTTDQGCIPRYKALLGHERIDALPFAAQPVIHNPIQSETRRDKSVCFAGSWREDKYPERTADMRWLLDAALDYGLDIYDRSHPSAKVAQERAYPEPYRRHVRGTLEYDRMLSAYRAYKVLLNVNSVKDSATMFSRRVFEAMASGAVVVSAESEGIRRMLGAHVEIVSSVEETRRVLRRLLEDEAYRERFAHLGYREVMQRHTYAVRLGTMLEKVGVTGLVQQPSLVSVLLPLTRPERLERSLDSIRRQVHPAVQTIIVLASGALARSDVEAKATGIPNLELFEVPGSSSIAECLNRALEHASGEYIARFDEDAHYGAHYLSDLLLATHYTDAPILGKRCHYSHLSGSGRVLRQCPAHSHCHVDAVVGATLLAKRDVFDRVRFSTAGEGIDAAFFRDCRALGLRIYSADPYNFLCVHGDDAGRGAERDQSPAQPAVSGVQPEPDLSGLMI